MRKGEREGEERGEGFKEGEGGEGSWGKVPPI